MILSGEILHPSGERYPGGLDRDEITLVLWVEEGTVDVLLKGHDRMFRFWPHQDDENPEAKYLVAPDTFPSSYQLLRDRFPKIPTTGTGGAA